MPAPGGWYSDEALRKQAAVVALPKGEHLSLEMLFGMYEPRTQPAAHEACSHCGGDGRDEAGGGESKGVRWCSLCLGRGRDQEW